VLDHPKILKEFVPPYPPRPPVLPLSFRGECKLRRPKMRRFFDHVFDEIFIKFWSTFDPFLINFASKVASESHVENDFEFKLFFMLFLHPKSLISYGRVIKNALFVSARNHIKKL